MPHGYRHENLQKLSFNEASELIRRSLGVFSEKLDGFDPKRAIFNFPYNASTSELERWLPTQVRAFRTGGDAIQSLPQSGRAKLTCTSHRPRDRATTGPRVRLADLQYARLGRRGLGSPPCQLSGAFAGEASDHSDGQNPSRWSGTGEVHRNLMRLPLSGLWPCSKARVLL